MKNSLKQQAFGWLIVSSVVLTGPSVFADERDQWRTGRTDDSIEVRAEDSQARSGRRAVEGIVEDISRGGNRFDLQTSRGEMTVLAPANVSVLAGDRTLRARDLRQGDRVRVTYDRASRGEIRATRIQVLSGISADRRSRPMDRGARPRREMSRDERAQRERDARENRGRYDREDRGVLQGTVVSVNERLDTFDVQVDDGRSIRVDAYPLRSRSGFSLRNLASGSRVTLHGEWMEGGTFRVDRVSQSRDSRGMRGESTRSRRQQMRDEDDDDDDHRDRDREDDDDDDEDDDDDPNRR